MEDRNFVTALARGLDILRCFDRAGVELSVSELGRRTGLNQPTTWRLCHTLVESGFLVRNPTNAALRIGAPALSLGYAAIEGMGFPAIALPYMQQLTAQTKASTTLSLQHYIEMISVQRSDGAFMLPNQPIGWRSLLTAVPSGLAVLAALPPAAQNATRQQLEAADPKSWPRRAARITAANREHAERGYVTRQAMLDGQYAAVAVALITTTGGQTIAWGLSCGGVTSHWNEHKLQQAGEKLRRVKSLLEPALAAIQNTGVPAPDRQSEVR